MVEYYEAIRLIHITSVIASGSLFLLRGLALFAGSTWAKAAPVRYLSYTIDTVLLTAAIMLMIVVRQYPFVQAWLTIKVLLVVLYIALGILAFREGRARHVRIACWVIALLVYGFVFSIARAHHPLGLFYGLAAF